MGERMVTGVACGLQNRHGAFTRPGWVRFPHVPATFILSALSGVLAISTPIAAQVPPEREQASPEADAAPTDPPPERQDTIPPVTPLGAFGRSLILPGWGQVAVGRPTRGAIYFAAEAP